MCTTAVPPPTSTARLPWGVRGTVRGWFALALCAFAGAGCSRRLGTGSEARPALWGYVLNPDTSAAAGARVWTEPPSFPVTTDSTGYWTIDGLAPGTYVVRAELAGIGGKSMPIPTRLGAVAERIVIRLGAEETAWPPPVEFDKHLPRGSRGPGVIRGRCCE
jgi:hypothetical protein